MLPLVPEQVVGSLAINELMEGVGGSFNSMVAGETGYAFEKQPKFETIMLLYIPAVKEEIVNTPEPLVDTLPPLIGLPFLLYVTA